MEEIYLSEEAFAYQSLQNFLSKFPDEEACLKLFRSLQSPFADTSKNLLVQTNAHSNAQSAKPKHGALPALIFTDCGD